MKRKKILLTIFLTLLLSFTVACNKEVENKKTDIKIEESNNDKQGDNHKINEKDDENTNVDIDEDDILDDLDNNEDEENNDDSEENNKKDINHNNIANDINELENINFPIVSSMPVDVDGMPVVRINTKRTKDELISALNTIFSGSNIKIESIESSDEVSDDIKKAQVNSFIIKTNDSPDKLMYFERFLLFSNTDFVIVSDDTVDPKYNPYRYIDIFYSKLKEEDIEVLDIDFLDMASTPSYVFTFEKGKNPGLDKMTEFVSDIIQSS